MAQTTTKWGADTPVSEPQPLRDGQHGLVSLGPGWVFTDKGFFPDLTEEASEIVFAPTYAPERPSRSG